MFGNIETIQTKTCITKAKGHKNPTLFVAIYWSTILRPPMDMQDMKMSKKTVGPYQF